MRALSELQAPSRVVRIESGRPTGQGEEHGHGVVGNLGRVHAGHVARQDAQLGCGGQVDRVDAHAHATDHLELGTCLEHASVGQWPGADRGAVGITQQIDELVFGADRGLDYFEASGLEHVDSTPWTCLHCDLHDLLLRAVTKIDSMSHAA